MFEVSHPFLFFDYWRIPNRPCSPDRTIATVPGCGSLRWTRGNGPRPTLSWAMPEAHAEWTPFGCYRIDSALIYSRVLPDGAVGRILADHGDWRPELPINSADGAVAASIWRDRSGSIFLPFDPNEAIRAFWNETYRAAIAGGVMRYLSRVALRGYYRIRPLLPRATQIALRRAFARVQKRTSFPRWPVEPALHDLYDFMFARTAEVAGEPVPSIAPWPGLHQWALVLTHDVETATGCRNVDALREPELATGFRSSWNFVPRRYEIPRGVLDELNEGGFEIGVHGLYHDGRDLESRATLEERLPAMRDAASAWGAVGFRSPATHRAWELMPLLGFDYDSSYPDTDPFEPQAGGCCSLLPYFNEDLVELPITLPQDHTLFIILRHTDEQVWIDKTQFISSRGGMALLITHPDYFLDSELVATYRRFLERYADDQTVWRALPREVSAWWRRRAATTLEATDGEWRLVGPAAGDARIALTGP